MSYMSQAAADRQLPRSHLLVLNRSFRRTLEAENKSARTMQAYTDAVRLLAAYCQAHGKPLLAGELRRDHIQAFIADQLVRWRPATAHNRYRACRPSSSGRWPRATWRPVPWTACDRPSYPSNPSTSFGPSTSPGGSRPARARLQQPPRHRHLPAASRHRDAPGRMRWHDPGRRRPGPADRLGAGQGPPTPGAADRSQDRPGTRPVRTDARRPPAGPPCAPVGRPQRTHDPLGDLPGHPRSSAGRGATGDASPISSGMPSPPVGSLKVATRTS